jgi:multisubunit Na+/H+ antiporter MnhB subunit
VNSLILKAATRLLVGLMLVFAVYLLFRGHNAPGGGFAGALVAAAAFALVALVEGPEAVRRALRMDARRLTALGLAVAMLSGFPALWSGKPFMTGVWGRPDPAAPLLGTPLLFDVGVFLTVLGAILALLLALEED